MCSSEPVRLPTQREGVQGRGVLLIGVSYMVGYLAPADASGPEVNKGSGQEIDLDDVENLNDVGFWMPP